MKKKLLLTLCVLFTATCINAMAACPVTGCDSAKPAQVCKCQDTCKCMKKCDKDIAAKRCKRFVKRVQMSRATIYNSLNLTEEQMKTREEILAKNTKTYEEKFANLFSETSKLKTLKAAGACEKEICAQKKVVKNIKNDIQALVDKENKEFKKCLTREQRAKFNTIKKLEKQSASKHKPDYHKMNPKMSIFGHSAQSGCPCKCPCSDK